MHERSQRLLGLSAWLTGFTPFELRGTGMLDAYLAVLDARLPRDLVDRLLASTGHDTTLDDPALGPLARNLVVMWYCGAWSPLPDTWSAATGHQDTSPPGILSAAAYQAGLQWAAANAHPAGARQQGFGAWSLPPPALIPTALIPDASLP